MPCASSDGFSVRTADDAGFAQGDDVAGGGRAVSCLSLEFGALSPKISRQLSAAGLRLDGGAASFFQRQADAVTLLVIHGTLSDGEAHKARRRLMKNIAEAVTTKGRRP